MRATQLDHVAAMLGVRRVGRGPEPDRPYAMKRLERGQLAKPNVAARAIGARADQARMLRNLAAIYARTNRLDTAEAALCARHGRRGCVAAAAPRSCVGRARDRAARALRKLDVQRTEGTLKR